MTHRRQDLRDLIVGYVTGLTTTGSRVTVGRTYNQEDLPAIDVTTPRELFESDRETRQLEVEFSIRSKAATPRAVLDELDLIASEVEEAMNTNYLFDGLGGASFQTTTEVELESAADQPTGLMTLTYTIVYQYSAP